MAACENLVETMPDEKGTMVLRETQMVPILWKALKETMNELKESMKRFDTLEDIVAKLQNA